MNATPDSTTTQAVKADYELYNTSTEQVVGRAKLTVREAKEANDDLRADGSKCRWIPRLELSTEGEDHE